MAITYPGRSIEYNVGKRAPIERTEGRLRQLGRVIKDVFTISKRTSANEFSAYSIINRVNTEQGQAPRHDSAFSMHNDPEVTDIMPAIEPTHNEYTTRPDLPIQAHRSRQIGGEAIARSAVPDGKIGERFWQYIKPHQDFDPARHANLGNSNAVGSRYWPTKPSSNTNTISTFRPARAVAPSPAQIPAVRYRAAA